MSASGLQTPSVPSPSISRRLSSSHRFLFNPSNLISHQFPLKIPPPLQFSHSFYISLRSNSNPAYSTRRLSSTDDFAEEARAAVADILREEGASDEAAIEIASNSPNYVRSLMESVQELDDASLWDSWKVGKGVDAVGSRLSFRDKVFYMAKEKRDRGIIPFLESAGLSPSSSMHIARYLTSETVPHLIHK